MSSPHVAGKPLPLERVARVLVHVLLFLAPVFFLPFTSDVLELNKQTLLVALTLSATLAWLGSMHVSRTISFRRGVLNAFPILVLGATAAAAVFSKAPYLSWIGGVNQQYTSVLSVLCYVALFYLAANLFDQPARQGGVYAAVIGSALLAGLAGLASLFGVRVPGMNVAVFNPVGTVNSLGILLAAVTVFANAWWVAYRGTSGVFQGKTAVLNKVLAVLLSLTTLVFLALVDYWVLWVVLLVGLASLFAFVLARAGDFPDVGRLTMPFFLTAFALLFLFWLPAPIRLNVPVEVTPNFKTSADMAWQTVRSSPFTGTGPGTFSFTYASQRPAQLNDTSFWNVRFDRPSSFFLLVPAAFGLVGTAAWLAFLIPLLIFAVSHMLRSRGEEWLPPFVIGTGWIALVAGLALYSANMTLLTAFFGLSGLLASQLMPEPAVKRFGQSPRVGLALSFAFILVSVGAVTVMFVSGQRYVADIAFAQAVSADRQKGDLNDIIRLLDRAASVNRFDDVYYRNLSQALVLKVGQELSAIKDVTALKPEDRKRIQDLTAAAVNASVRATDLSPQNALNWQLRGSVYRALIPLRVTQAAEFAAASFDRAVALEPNNPMPVTELGRTYLASAQLFQQMTGAKDEETKQKAKDGMEKNLALAEQQFNKAITLKADYSPAHYQLAGIYAQRGKLDEAIGKMESVVKYNQTDVGAAFQLGLLYLRRAGKDDQARAQAALEYAVQLSPSYSNARWFLASIYEQQGKVDKALEQIQKVAELNPDNDLVKSRLERLQKGTVSKTVPAPLEDTPSATSVPNGQPTQ